MVTKTIFCRLPVLFLVTAVLFFTHAQSQDVDYPTKEYYSGRREALRNLLPRNGAAILFSNPVRNRSNDVDFQFSQNPDFYYLTGFKESDAMLWVFHDSVKWNSGYIREILFIEGPSTVASTWSGPFITPEAAKQKVGIEDVALNAQYALMKSPLCTTSSIWINYPEFPRKSPYATTGLTKLVAHTKEVINECPLAQDTLSLMQAMAQLREVKQPEEIVLLSKAISMSIAGFQELIASVKQGMKEYQAQAIFEYVTKKEGAEYQGYPSISGSGANGCVLHYTLNREKLKSGELLLADMGAEYHGYTADITRTIPVNGKFSEAQKALYELVLNAQNAGIEACRVGSSFNASHLAAKKVLAAGLLALGIIKTEGEVTTYFMHGTSHYLGLDVHDAGTKGALKAGTVMTVEPGLYIRNGAPCDPKWWNIGIRIEDDILVTSNGPVVLSKELPRTIAEIEKLMTQKSRFEDDFK